MNIAEKVEKDRQMREVVEFEDVEALKAAR